MITGARGCTITKKNLKGLLSVTAGLLPALAADILTKHFMWETRDGTLIPGLLNHIRVQNTGMSFGLFSDGNLPLILISAAAILLIVLWLARNETSRIQRVLSGILLGGAVGNLFDRVRFGFVRDFFQFDFFRSFPVFNLADASIVVSAVLIVFFLIVPGRRSVKVDGNNPIE